MLFQSVPIELSTFFDHPSQNGLFFLSRPEFSIGILNDIVLSISSAENFAIYLFENKGFSLRRLSVDRQCPPDRFHPFADFRTKIDFLDPMIIAISCHMS
jgi:hypothetical protein